MKNDAEVVDEIETTNKETSFSVAAEIKRDVDNLVTTHLKEVCKLQLIGETQNTLKIDVFDSGGVRIYFALTDKVYGNTTGTFKTFVAPDRATTKEYKKTIMAAIKYLNI